MDRRTLFALTGATAMAAALRPLAAQAKETLPLDLRGMDGQLRRLPSLDVMSNQEFLTEVGGLKAVLRCQHRQLSC